MTALTMIVNDCTFEYSTIFMHVCMAEYDESKSVGRPSQQHLLLRLLLLRVLQEEVVVDQLFDSHSIRRVLL
jgi:hypothetical protein